MATTALDSFVIELSIDPKQLTAGAAQALDALRKVQQEGMRGANEVEAKQKSVFDLMLGFRREAMTILGVFLGGKEIGDFIGYITKLDAATGRLAKTMDMTPSDVRGWQGALEQIGGTAEDANSALSGLSSEMFNFQLTGQSSMLPVLTRLGISLYDQNRQLKTSGELWLELADAVKGMDPGFAKAFLSKIPGANEGIINLALLGRSAMEGYIKSAKEARDLTKEQVDEASDYQKELALLKDTSDSLGQSLLMTFGAPLIGAMSRAAGFLRDLRTGKLAKNFSDTILSGHFPIESVDTDNPVVKDYLSKIPGADVGNNWDKYARRLSFLETDITNAQAYPGHSASGFFQFMPNTAAEAISAGIPDPRAGGFAQQESAWVAFVKKFNPSAGAALDKGDFETADRLLKGRWPSLPGGSQAQSESRYSAAQKFLNGPSPGARSIAGSSGVLQQGLGGNSSGVSIGQITVNVNAPHVTDAKGVANEIGPEMRRMIDATAFNNGLN
jgi:hypothetical protein